MHPRCIRRAQECTEVLRILDTIEQEQERILSSLSRRCDDLLDCDVGNGCDVGEHALMAHALGHSGIQLGAVHDVQCDAVLTREIAQLAHTVSMQPICEQDAVDAAPRLDRLCDGVATGKDVRGALVRVLLSAMLCPFHMCSLTLSRAE